MNREILFRGKAMFFDLKWHEGSYWFDEKHNEHLIVHRALFPIKVHPHTVGQYTGLDAGLNKIFEDDILTPYHNGEVFLVSFDLGRFVVKQIISDSKACRVWWIWGTLIQFIMEYHESVVHLGNIHDNPELIEVIPSAK